MSTLSRLFRADRQTADLDGTSGTALSRSLALAHTRPSASRGLGYASDLCQVVSIHCANAEIEHDCWRFTLKGARKPDKRPWAAILASGDNVKIEFAERIAFLDWENLDKNAITTTDSRGRRHLAATRRPWSPPATQPEAGKPAAPAKGKGKRASTKS